MLLIQLAPGQWVDPSLVKSIDSFRQMEAYPGSQSRVAVRTNGGPTIEIPTPTEELAARADAIAAAVNAALASPGAEEEPQAGGPPEVWLLQYSESPCDFVTADDELDNAVGYLAFVAKNQALAAVAELDLAARPVLVKGGGS